MTRSYDQNTRKYSLVAMTNKQLEEIIRFIYRIIDNQLS